MPYFPPAPGGGVLLPNTIDNVMLVDMPDGTVKGRALGAGVGDPQDLTLTQLRVLLGNPVFTQCRLIYVSSSTMRLTRFGGKFFTIDDAPQLIPAAGVDLIAVAGHVGVNPMYIYAYMNAGVMTLIGQASGAGSPVVDPRNGMMVATNNPALSLVGMAFVSAGPAMAEDGANQAVSSYYNRRPRGYAYGQNNTTASTSPVMLHNPIRMLTWSDSAYSVFVSGWSQLNVSGITLGQIYMDSVAVSQQCISYFTTPNGQNPLALALVYSSADGIHSFQLGGYVGAGTGTFVGNTYGTVMG